MGQLVSKEEQNALSQVDELKAHCQASKECLRDTVKHAVAAGIILRIWKDTLPRGTWEQFRDTHFPFSERTAQLWMKASESAEARPLRFLEPDVTIGKLLSYVQSNEAQQNRIPPISSTDNDHHKPPKSPMKSSKTTEPSEPPPAPEPQKSRQPDILKRRDGWRASIVKLRESMQEAINGECGELTHARSNALREVSGWLDEAYKTLGRIR